MLVRDEADVIEPVVRHTAWHVDEILAVDHRSTDGTRQILTVLRIEGVVGGLQYLDDRGMSGDAAWTSLSRIAHGRGHEWAVVVDADDVWHTGDDDLRVADLLAAAPADALAMHGPVLNHVPTADDTDEPNPLLRIGWRRTVADARKVAFRLSADVLYAEHNAWRGGEVTHPIPGLLVRHFSIRRHEQLVRKIRNGMDAHDHSPIGRDPLLEEGWARWRGLTDDQIVERFYAEFWTGDPEADPTLVYDPAPVQSS